MHGFNSLREGGKVTYKKYLVGEAFAIVVYQSIIVKIINELGGYYGLMR